MAIVQPRSDLPPVHDPTRDPDSYGSPAQRGRYWGAAVVGIVGLAVFMAVLVWLAFRV